MSDSVEWTCGHCSLLQIGTGRNIDENSKTAFVGTSVFNRFRVGWTAVRCLNPSCNKISLNVYLAKSISQSGGGEVDGQIFKKWRLMPEASYKEQPAYIPTAIKSDYYEACLIRETSPKASATLARRCMQGMIRDFCGISERTLDAEIKKLKKAYEEGTAPRAVSDESIVAIDKVRQIGNIGAHMERDINVIIDVDPEEAQALIGLIELLFAEWYIDREKRRLRLEELTRISDEKQAQRALPPPT